MTAEAKFEKDGTPTKLLHVRRMPTRSQIKRVEWDVEVEKGITLDDLLEPSYWANVCENTFVNNRFNKVCVHWEDGEQYAELYVRQSGHNFAMMEVIFHHEFGGREAIADVGLYDVIWSGISTKYRIIRKSDNQIIKDGFKSAPAAEDFIEQLGTRR